MASMEHVHSRGGLEAKVDKEKEHVFFFFYQI